MGKVRSARRSVPRTFAVELVAGNDVPNASYQTLFEVWLEENIVDAGGGGFRSHVPVRIAGNENDRRHDIPPAQTDCHVETVHVRHFIVDHQTVDIVGVDAGQQRHSSTERADRKAMGFEKKPQRLKHVSIVIENTDSVFWDGQVYHLMPRIRPINS